MYADTNWNLPPEKLAARTFDTEQQAKQWFQDKYTDSVEFSGFHQTQRYMTNWVSCKGQEVGEITKRFYDHH